MLARRIARFWSVLLSIIIILGISVKTHAEETIPWIIKPHLNYSYVFDYSDGHAVVNQGGYYDIWRGRVIGGKFGFIDKAGKEVIPLIYNSATGFSQGMAAVRKGDKENGKWGFVNKQGKIIVPLIYDEVYPFAFGIAAVNKGGKWGYVDLKGKAVLPTEYDEIVEGFGGTDNLTFLRKIDKGNLVSLYDKRKKTFIIKSADGIHQPSDGLIRVQRGEKYGFVDASGKIVLPFIYDDVGEFHEGLVVVGKRDPKSGVWKYGYMNKKGKIVIPCIYRKAGDFSEGIATVGIDYNTKTGNWRLQLIDKNGKKLIKNDLYHSDIYNFKNGIAVVGNWDEKKEKWTYGLIDKKGKIILPIVYDMIEEYEDYMTMTPFPKEMKVIGIKDKNGNMIYGLTDKNGKILVKPSYKGLSFFSDKALEVSAEDKDGSRILLDVNTFKVIENTNHFGVWEYLRNNFYVVRKGSIDLVIVNDIGQKVLPYTFELGSLFVAPEGITVKLDGKWGILNHLPAGFKPIKESEQVTETTSNIQEDQEQKIRMDNKVKIVKDIASKYGYTLEEDVELRIDHTSAWFNIKNEKGEIVCEFNQYLDLDPKGMDTASIYMRELLPPQTDQSKFSFIQEVVEKLSGTKSPSFAKNLIDTLNNPPQPSEDPFRKIEVNSSTTCSLSYLPSDFYKEPNGDQAQVWNVVIEITTSK